MPNYYKFKKKLLEGNIALLTDVIKVALVRNTYAVDPNHEFFSSVSGHQVVDAGYAAGGSPLTGKAINQVVNKVYFDAVDLQWTIAANINVKYIIVYKDTTVPGTSPLIAYFELDPERAVVTSTITLKLAELGLLELQ